MIDISLIKNQVFFLVFFKKPSKTPVLFSPQEALSFSKKETVY